MVCASRLCWNIVLCCAMKQDFFLSCSLSAVRNLFRFPCVVGGGCRWCSEFFGFGKFTLTALQFSFNCLENDRTSEEMCWRRNVFSTVFYDFSSKRCSSCKYVIRPAGDARISIPYIGLQVMCPQYLSDSNLLTPWSRVLLKKLTGSAASQEIPRIFGTRRLLTVLTSARHLSLSWANSIQSPQLTPTSW
jgi:hypothetical protein